MNRKHLKPDEGNSLKENESTPSLFSQQFELAYETDKAQWDQPMQGRKEK